MPTRNLDKIFSPRRVAVVGASDRPGTVGHALIRNLVGSGFQGVVYPVNPAREAVQGIHAWPNVKSLPHPPDLAVLAIPAGRVPDVVRECGESGVRGLVIISAGFRESGEEGKALEDRVLEEARRFDGMRIIGPNCLGFIVPGLKLNASFAAAMPAAGRVAFLSQSGALCTSVLDWAAGEGVGFSLFVSTGNMLDVGMSDLLDYLAADPATDSVILYLESITKARDFMSAARAFARVKPIVAYKAGRFAESAKAAASHTGALAGLDDVYEAALKRAGIVRISQMDDMFDCAELLARRRMVRGRRLAILTNAGGPGVMATDALMERRGTLAPLAPATIEQLNAVLPPFWSHGNPVDVLGDAPAERFSRALSIVVADPSVDAALVMLAPQAMTDPTTTARAVAAVADGTDRPVLAAWIGGPGMQPAQDLLNRAGIPTYSTPEKAVRAFSYLVAHAANRETLYETPRDIPIEFRPDKDRARTLFQRNVEAGHTFLSEDESKALLEEWSIPVVRSGRCATADEAVQGAKEMGYPVVLKVDSPDITHKTDVGGVVLGLSGEAEVRAAFKEILTSARRCRPDASLRGVTVQRMVRSTAGFEMILGAKKDPVFGAVILAGMGGIAAEVLNDRALELPPLNERLAMKMLESLRSWPLLMGYRGRARANVDRLIEVMIRVSALIADRPEILELDINPLVVTPEEVIALDARVIIDAEAVRQPPRRYAHLAIHPYPEEYVQNASLKDGTPVVLRPIKPEDEPLWQQLLESCSQQSIWFRFRYVFKEITHEMASRFCYIDYDREMAIVAERVEDGHRRLIGVGRLVGDADHHRAEFAVLVADRWQGHGLGSILLDTCIRLAGIRGFREVYAETTPDNVRMLATFRKWGFDLNFQLHPDVVVARKGLAG